MNNKIAATALSSVLAVLLMMTSHAPVHAASFKGLKSDGYTVSKLSRNKAGKPGWFLRKGSDRFFCRSRASGAIVDSRTILFFTATGRQIKGDRRVYEKRSGPVENRLPTLRAYRNGSLSAKFVGRCSKIR